MARVSSGMRSNHFVLGAFLLVLPLQAARTQDAPLRVHVDLGAGAFGSRAPYRAGLAATARMGVALRVNSSLALALDGHLLGSATNADAYGSVSRPVPNTVGVSLSVVPALGHRRRFALDVGGGVYSVAARANAPGGRTAGFHVGTSATVAQWDHLALRAGLRALLLTGVHGTSILCVPATIGLSSR